ncbi:MAG TPA: 50S ribosomal protein L10 [Nitrospinota bacterium]|jgi:large subunit ribosomal protein L10|nr:50S ribosomal protein L10 [Nitrospinota bacterium]|tara:strand:- start:21302 stop:21835 length:534 start_codon:yes stop_codon:yes gene_type:complete
MVHETKIQEVESIKTYFNESKCAVLADYRGVSADEMTELRRKLRENNSKLKVMKNTLARLAAKDTTYECVNDLFNGPVSVAFGMGEDVSAPAKVMTDFAKENKNLEILGGIVEGAVLDSKAVLELSKMPPKPVIQAMLLGVFEAPSRNFLGVLEGTAKKFLYALSAIAEKKNEIEQG